MCLLILAFVLIGCRSNQSMDEASYGGVTEAGDFANNVAGPQRDDASVEVNEEIAPDKADRMVMYNVYLELDVENITEIMDSITTETEKQKGYVIESSRSNYGNKQSANMVIRIPSESLHSYIKSVESLSEAVREKEIVGSDVTEEYTDLESRLKAKKAVEERLFSFLKDAEKTEDLLKISDDLAKIQEQIEQIEGRTEYATVTISLQDVSVHVPSIHEDDLKTGSKIKEAFVNSINALKKFGSYIIIFFIGYSPFIILLLLIGITIYFIRKKRKHKDIN